MNDPRQWLPVGVNILSKGPKVVAIRHARERAGPGPEDRRLRRALGEHTRTRALARTGTYRRALGGCRAVHEPHSRRVEGRRLDIPSFICFSVMTTFAAR